MTGAGSLALVDPCCARGYAPAALQAGGLGGTEATVLRVTSVLSTRMPVVHYQRGRTDTVATDAGLMRPLADAFAPDAAGTFVVINAWKVACKLRRAHPAARIVLWLHVHPGRHNRPMATALAQAGVAVVCVSASHAATLRAFLSHGPALAIDHIHNPIADGLAPDATPHDPDALLFASAPHKGLVQVYARFTAARQAIPSLTLAVADPGYLAWDTGPVPDGVTLLGAMPHAALIARMRRSLCLFYPQTRFAETFGLVMAEAQAVGLPVLAHCGLGANDEVVGPGQLLDCHDDAQIVTRLQDWRRARPVVGANPAFRLSAVCDRWMALLDGAAMERVA
ncbi:Glycosyl transferases group 1 [Loktanella fryxellensis]|uniref:Glycosyl transferases group 1 n=1 Tax=Loktanella fryxellensis TaxID=245187 RepID=A0A1H8HAD3_9RHOB|nr:glycosyltransferase [Loktanella fryxellensis]SEN52929.1 Glycosyl transferases group 1 [Loktanella fryxellensis]